MIQLDGELIAWRSFNQCFVAVSSTQMEYISLAEACRRYYTFIISYRGLIGPTMIYEDNQPEILWSTEHGKLNYHVDIRYHISWDSVMSLNAKLECFPTTEVLADM